MPIATDPLVDYLYKKNYKYPEGKEGVHPETYKIFVNFHIIIRFISII